MTTGGSCRIETIHQDDEDGLGETKMMEVKSYAGRRSQVSILGGFCGSETGCCSRERAVDTSSACKHRQFDVTAAGVTERVKQ